MLAQDNALVLVIFVMFVVLFLLSIPRQRINRIQNAFNKYAYKYFFKELISALYLNLVLVKTLYRRKLQNKLLIFLHSALTFKLPHVLN